MVFIAVLLLLALALTVGVGWQAHDAARSHRETAEAVLEDYAELAASEMIRRSLAVFIRTYNYPLRLAVLRALEADGEGPLPAPRDLPTDSREERGRIFRLAQFLFRYRLGDPGSLEIAGEPPTAAELTWLGRVLTEHVPGFPSFNLPYLMLYGPPEAPLMAFYWAEGGVDQDNRLVPGARVVGVGIDRRQMSQVFAEALGQDRILPAALAGDDVGNEHVRITVWDWTGSELFRSGARIPTSGASTAEKSFDPFYDGILHGWRVRAEIAPEAAPRLIIGGLPRSRLPTLLGLLALAAGLVAVALRLLTWERELTELRSDFVSRVSHELRTPLTQIRMFAETLLLDRVRSPEERRRSIEIVDAEAKRLSHLVENILQLSRSERGALRVTPERQDLSRALQRLVSELRPLVESGRLGDGDGEGDGVRLTADIEPEIVARVDPDALRQIVLNLLDNAVKHGSRAASEQAGRRRRSPEVRIALERCSHRARMTVEDDGPGVPIRDRDRIWRRFHRLDRDAARSGAGIGLAVVRDLVLAHDGTVWVEGVSGGGAPGEAPSGARFVVELPLDPSGEPVGGTGGTGGTGGAEGEA